jgi:hypothetical protein
MSAATRVLLVGALGRMGQAAHEQIMEVGIPDAIRSQVGRDFPPHHDKYAVGKGQPARNVLLHDQHRNGGLLVNALNGRKDQVDSCGREIAGRFVQE